MKQKTLFNLIRSLENQGTIILSNESWTEFKEDIFYYFLNKGYAFIEGSKVNSDIVRVEVVESEYIEE